MLKTLILGSILALGVLATVPVAEAQPFGPPGYRHGPHRHHHWHHRHFGHRPY